MIKKLSHKKGKRSSEGIFDTVFRLSLMLVFAIVLVLLLSCTYMDYACKRDYALENVHRVIIAAVLSVAAVVYAIRKPAKGKSLHERIKIASCVLLMAQLYMLANIFFLTDWDPGVVYDVVKNLPVNASGWENQYLSRYPNNLLLVIIESMLLSINHMAGILSETHELMVFGILNCMVSTYVCYQTYKILFDLTQSERSALAGYLLTVVLVGLSPWMVIGYSDTLGLLFPTLILKVFCSKEDSNNHAQFCVKWVKIVLLAAVGYCIKPQCVIVFIAICIVMVTKKFSWKTLLQMLCVGMVFVLALVSVNAGIDAIAEKNGIVLEKEEEFGWQHFLMMGLNKKTNGFYSDEDVSLSASAATTEERKALNYSVAKERFSNFGWGILGHFAKKVLTVFNDGTFAWACDGSFYKTVLDEPNQVAAPFLRSIFYSYGSNYHTYASIIQTVWIGVLFLLWIGCFADREGSPANSVIRLSILGLFLFEMLFEVRARYLFTYVPFFIILAMCGLHGAKKSVENWAFGVEKE